ncbi:MAG: 3,4-dihydroxy-2-butanone-4-phosphate synthase, partial [Aestuariibacter sp.]|nr:3,4-dihydroxy-2-butanone-4-phosphate synthase [Aestuariibacter sp.]
MSLSSIEDAIKDFTEGKPIIVVDDEDRENEGDLILAAEKATPENIAFMIRHTSGIICAPSEEERLDEMELPIMVEQNSDPLRTAFTVSTDYIRGMTTGVSAVERANTLRALADETVSAADFIRPGHIFPLKYRAGGVLVRSGHTEAAVDLCKLAGLKSVGALAELNHDDGTMMRLPALIEFA